MDTFRYHGRQETMEFILEEMAEAMRSYGIRFERGDAIHLLGLVVEFPCLNLVGESEETVYWNSVHGVWEAIIRRRPRNGMPYTSNPNYFARSLVYGQHI